jgi:RHS repeat-associated protein
MGSHWRSVTSGHRLLFVLGCVAALVVALAVATEAGSAGRSALRQVAQPPASVARDVGRYAAMRRRLASRPERTSRRRSRTQFRHLGTRAAVGLAERTFPRVFAGELWRPPSLRRGERVVGHLGNRAVVVAGRRGRAVVESTRPLRARDQSGHDAPIDTTLVDAPDGLRPQNASVSTSIAKDGPASVTLDDQGIGVGVAGGRRAHASVDRDKATFANVLADTDVVAAAMPDGVELMFQLRSSHSPEAPALDFTLPAGASLRPISARRGSGLPDAASAVQIVKGGTVLARVSAPSAVDADGRPVPVSYAVSGTRLEVRVDHRQRDVRYPILVDPYIMEYFEFNWGTPADMSFAGWTFSTYAYGGTPMHNTSYGPDLAGLYAYVNPGDHLNTNEYGAYRWKAPAGTNIWKFQARIKTVPFYGYFRRGVGIWNDTAGWENGSNPPNTTFGPESHVWTTVCAAAGCPETGGRYGNEAWFYYQATAAVTTPSPTPNPSAYAYMGAAYIWLSDGYAPTVATPTGAGNDGQWHDGTIGPFTLSSSDVGLGVSYLTVKVGSTGLWYTTPGCDGHRTSPCPTSYSPSVSYSAQDMPEGVSTEVATAGDPTGQTGSTSWQTRIDRSPPNIALSGALKAAEGTRVDDRNYGLHIDATDGSAATGASERSGVKSVTIKVDGKAVPGASWTQSCPQSNCGMSRDWTFNSERYAAGEHTIQVVATDQLNHTAPPSSFTVTVVHAASADAGPGSVNLRTGNFTLGRSDAAIDSTGSGLAVSRSYNSRDLGASVNSPFGPGWTPSVPVDGPTGDWIQLDVIGNLSADGVVEVTTADGDKVDFTPKPGGGFDAPEGFEDLTLTSPSGRYELKDLDGNVTVFTQPAGTPAGSTTYLPTEVRTPSAGSGASTVSYEFQTGAARIKQLTTPPPSGVDCVGALVRGCRALSFVYAATTTATSGTPGDYAGRVVRIDLTAYDPDTGAMSTTAIARYAYATSGRLAEEWDPRVSPALKEQYSYDSAGNLTGVTPAGQETWTLNYAQPSKPPTDPDYPNDPNSGRLLSVSRPALPGTATQTVVYGVPISGAGAPYAMGAGNVAAWGQGNVPVTATAIFPPDQVPPSQTPSDYSHATVHYLDTKGREVNTATPGGRISTSEYDSHDNVVRELTPANRERALSGGSSAARAAQIDTQRSYNADGTLLLDELGPLHQVKLASGETVDARPHTHITYDEGAPAGGPYGLPTSTTYGAQIAGRPDADTRTKTTSYDWTLRSPTSDTVDPGGLNLTTKTLYDGATGQVIETRQPANPNGGDARAKQSIYYSGSASDPACTGHPEWSGLLCKEKPAAQPGSPGLPDLPVTTYTYNRLGEQRTTTETVGSTAQRTTSITYDAAGRPLSTAISASEGSPVPTVTTGYDAATGLATTTTAQTQSGAVSVVQRQFDTLGRLTSYTDADGNVSSTTYDIDARPVTRTDGKGTQTYTYDPITGDAIQIADSGVGTMTATYDADGQLKVETLPGGLQQQVTYDEAGDPTRIAYVKTTNCSSNCTWLDLTGARGIHDEWMTNSGTLSNQSYAYDKAGRLTEARDTPNGGSCTVRSYSYDGDSNRTLSVSHPAAADGSCAPASAGTSASHSYDAADRLTDSSVIYDNFGRETALPSSDNAGKGSLALTYYGNDLTQSIRQGTTTKVFTLDPALRQRTVQTIGGDGQTRTLHYSDDGDSPGWMTESSDGNQWSRPVEGFDGDLVATQTEAGARLMLTNLHGDIVAEATTSPTATGLTKTYEADEFGIPKSSAAGRFAWLGSNERRTEFPDSGVISMGVRTYIPGIGRFSSPDPIVGGSANDYDYANQDPVNGTDLSGTSPAGPRPRFVKPSRLVQAWRFFRRRGLTRAGAAALIGNFRVEAPGLKPRTVGAGGARGIAQWESARWHQLLAWANGRNPYRLRVQLQFVWYELTHRSEFKSVYKYLRRVRTSKYRKATRRVMDEYEIAGDRSSLGRRIRCARKTLHLKGGHC